jgi:hypothetical protein
MDTQLQTHREEVLGGFGFRSRCNDEGEEGTNERGRSKAETNSPQEERLKKQGKEANRTARGRTEAIAKFVLFVFIFFFFPTNTRSKGLMRLGRAK